MGMNSATNQDFWRAALQFYDKPGAVEALLTLQDEHQGDVMATLWVLAACSHSRLLTTSDIATYQAHTKDAAKKAVALRAKRRGLKSGPPGPYAAAKQAELAAERAIAAAAPDPADAGMATNTSAEAGSGAALAAVNLDLLFRDIDPPLALRQELTELLGDT